MAYFVKTPGWLRRFYGGYVWKISNNKNRIFLTFDDGPHPEITPYVLNILQQYNIKATFFCIGKNVLLYPAVFDRIKKEGHAIGNHTHNHLNGWKTNHNLYVENVKKAKEVITSNLFRPPYGRISRRQATDIQFLLGDGSRIIMWDVLSADFDTTISAEKCTNNILKYTTSGSIIVYHDSEKAFPRLQQSLPAIIPQLLQKGFVFDVIT